jgi:hypothetical protein
MNPYLYDSILAKPLKRQTFWHNNEKYSFTTDLRNGYECYEKLVKGQWITIQATIDIELSFETRKSRRLV